MTATTLLAAAAASADAVPIEDLRLAPIRAADPFGGPAHTFATFRSTLTFGDRTFPVRCIKQLRIDGDQLGTTDPVTGAFVPTTLEQAVAGGVSDNCGGGLPLVWMTLSAGPGPTVTLDGGWFGPGVTSVSIKDHDRWKPLPFTADGQFLVALPGDWAPERNALGIPMLPLVRVTATLCGPDARGDLLDLGDTTRTSRCELASYWPARYSPMARMQRHRGRKHRR
jgi:hypothetical protein